MFIFVRKTIKFIRGLFLPIVPKSPIKIGYTDKPKNEKPPKFKPGDKVVCISNEPESYQIGIIKEYIPITKAQKLTPVIVYEDGSEMLSLTHLEPYSEELCEQLDKLTGIEQWNYTTRHIHCQIKEKYGIKYKTFECDCESCKRLRSRNEIKTNTDT